MNKMILVVDPQVDFISGSLPVAGAADAMEALAEYLRTHGAEYAVCAITADWHPSSHMSFVQNGGQWPEHCVAFSVGAAIFPSVYKAALRHCQHTCVLTKGMQPDREEYSIFANEKSAAELDHIISSYNIDRIDICGIAYDICVSDTLTDGIRRYGPDIFYVLPGFCPSIDAGARLNEIIIQYGLH